VVQPSSFLATAHLGWDETGFWFACDVQDDQLTEAAAPLLGNDGLEFFLSPALGSGQMIQYIISPGITTEFPKARMAKVTYHTGQQEAEVHDITVVGQPQPGGYRVEGHMPWTALGIHPHVGEQMALNCYLNDVDQGQKTPHSWHHYPSTYDNRRALYALTLTRQAAGPQPLIKAYLEDQTTYHLIAVASPALAGKTLSLTLAGQSLGALPLTPEGTLAQGHLRLAAAQWPSGDLTIALNGTTWRQTLTPDQVQRHYVSRPRPHRFEEAIRLFEAQDRLAPPPPGGTLFVGSSSIRAWPDLAGDFPEVAVIQRGFGGSRSADVLHFFDRIVAPYRPRRIVLFAGINDINAGLSPDSVRRNTERFLQRVAAELPQTEVLVLSLTISPSRQSLTDQYLATNALLGTLVNQYPQARFVDLVPAMLDANGDPRAALFGPDRTHLSPQGYALWREHLRPWLVQP
jgi:lysophospholipase L1-like esterase